MWAESGVHFVPKEVVHDNGSEFKKFFEKTLELLQIDQTWSVAGRPESHGVIEKFNQDICSLLGKRVSDRRRTIQPHEKKWSWAVPAATAAVNSAPSRATSIGIKGYSPSEVFHGLEAIAPIDRAWTPKGQCPPMREDSSCI